MDSILLLCALTRSANSRSQSNVHQQEQQQQQLQTVRSRSEGDRKWVESKRSKEEEEKRAEREWNREREREKSHWCRKYIPPWLVQGKMSVGEVVPTAADCSLLFSGALRRRWLQRVNVECECVKPSAWSTTQILASKKSFSSVGRVSLI